MSDSIAIGSHLVTSRVGYTHHGIYVGNDRVIHYSGLADGMNTGPVEEVSFSKFTCGNGYSIKEHKNAKFDGYFVVQRARSRIGENLYSVFSNNCEHFCEWCVNDDHSSEQVDIASEP